MRQMTSQVAIVERANELAADLCSGPVPVERNTLLSVVADFLSDPRSKPERLERTLSLLEQGSGGHLKRSEGFRLQAKEVIRVIGGLLRSGDFAPESLRSLLGWTARLLLVRRPARREPEPVAGGGNGVKTGVKRTPSFAPPRPTKPLPKPPARPHAPPLPLVVSSGAPNWRARLQSLGWGNAGTIVAPLLAELEGDDRREAAREIIVRLERRALKKQKDKPWVQALFTAAGEE